MINFLFMVTTAISVTSPNIPLLLNMFLPTVTQNFVWFPMTCILRNERKLWKSFRSIYPYSILKSCFTVARCHFVLYVLHTVWLPKTRVTKYSWYSQSIDSQSEPFNGFFFYCLVHDDILIWNNCVSNTSAATFIMPLCNCTVIQSNW